MPAITSVWKLVFVRSNGGRVTLLDYGDGMDTEPSWPTEQQVSSYSGLALTWGTNSGDGGAKRSMNWSRHRTAASNQARFIGMMTDSALAPYGEEGTFELSHLDGATFQFASGVVQGCVPVRRGFRFDYSLVYRGLAGETTPLSDVPETPELPWSWRLTAWQDLTGTWADL